MSFVFTEISSRILNRSNATLFALNHHSHNALERMLKDGKSDRQEICAFYKRQAEGMPCIPNYLENSVYARLVQKQYSVYLEARDPKRPVRSTMSESDSETEDDWQVFCESPLSAFKIVPRVFSKEQPTSEEFWVLKSLLRLNSIKVPLLAQDLRLPSAWNTSAKGRHADISVNRLQLTYNDHDSGSEVSSARADHSIKRQCGIYYFEVKILSTSTEAKISIGLSAKVHGLNKLPGSEDYSWGYNGDSGEVYSGPGTGKSYGPKFGHGDIIGCGIDFRDMSTFYTKNGVFLGTAFQRMEGADFYPCVGFATPGDKVRANFGSSPFQFDIQHHLTIEKESLLNHLSPTPITQSTIISSSLASDMADKVIMEYLKHHGYDSTAKSLLKSLELKGTHPITDNSMDTEALDLQHRKEIRKAILCGNINTAFKLCNRYYTDVLEKNPMIVLKLKCRRFMEMVKEVQQSRFVPQVGDDEYEAQQLRISENGTLGSSKRDANAIVAKEMNGRQKKQKIADQNTSGFSDIIQYGRALKDQYEQQSRSDDAIKSELMAAFSTLAYTDLNHPAIAYLYDTLQLESVASELNSAILVSHGKSSCTSLERIYRQTNTIVDDLVLMGNAQAALLQPQKHCFHSLEY